MSDAPFVVRWLRALARVIPRGRYRLVSLAPAEGTFLSALSIDAGGAAFRCDLSDMLCREVSVTGVYEPPVSRVIQRLLPPGGTMIDVGANWGYFSLLGGAAVGPGGSVVALEPHPRQFQILQQNIALNGWTHVTTLQAAAAATHGRATLSGYTHRETNRGTSRISDQPPAGANAFDVLCVPLDAVATDQSQVNVVKIDVEGFEDSVLSGMEQGLARGRYDAIVLELHPSILRDRGVDPESCNSLLARHGYSGATIDHSPSGYRRALDPTVSVASLLKPLEDWRSDPWPHLLWRR